MNLPESWREVRLSDVCNIGSGDGAPQEAQWFSDEGIPFVRVSDLSIPRDGIRLVRTRDHFTPEATAELRLRTWKVNSLLMPKSGASALLNQRALLGCDACVVSHLAIIEPTTTISPEYLYWWSTEFDAARIIPDTSYPSIRLQDLARVKLPLPSLPEQQRIVNVIAQAAKVAKAKRSFSDLIDRLIRTAYWQHFGDWYTAEGLRDPVRIADYFSDTQYGISEAMEERGTHAVLRMNSLSTSGWLDLTDLKYANLARKDADNTKLLNGDLIFNRTNSKELVGKCAIWRETPGLFSFASYLVRLRLRNGMLPEYLWATLNSAYGKYRLFNAAKQAVSMANVSPTDLGRITVPLPPLPLQEDFAQFVRQVENLRTAMLEKLEAFEELRNQVAQQALIGELTSDWREQHREEITEAAQTRDTLLRQRGTKLTIRPSETVFQATPATETQLPARAWLLSELSDFQRLVFDAFIAYPDQPLLAEDPDVFALFCLSEALNEKLAAFPPTSPNHLRRTLSQLAALGLIAKVTLPKTNTNTREQEFLTAFRPLRPGEQTRTADVAMLRRSLDASSGQAGEGADA